MANQNEVTEAYRLYITGEEDNVDRAYAKLDAIGYNNLQTEDKKTLIHWYIEQGQYTKALQIDPESDVSVVDDIRSENEGNAEAILSELETLETSFPESDVIKFERASFEEDYAGMVENSHLTSYDEKRAKLAVKSFIIINEMEELDSLIEDYKDREDDEKSYENLQNQYDKYYDKYAEQMDSRENLQQLKEELEDKQEELEKADDKDEKQKIEESIEDIEKEIENDEKTINKTEDDIKNDDEV